ncbi:PIN domain-containing protein [Micromonospora sp. NBC_01699]|uniref:PIN domain-containing protein n=1 Tax=Micromonospora sp. NBC_01699 TaxID=2975984 RepID=UPI002E282FC9|nr:PIN domain-containing protein [Micromonospora sp. NBC_01699]
MPFSALLDANVLVPNVLRDTLLRIAGTGLYRPLWSDDILAETRRTVLRLHPKIEPAKFDRTITHMNRSFDDALVTNYRSVVDGMTNDPGDRHVLAAAVVGPGRPDRHPKPQALPEGVTPATGRRPGMRKISVEDLRTGLSRSGAPDFADRIKARLSVN